MTKQTVLTNGLSKLLRRAAKIGWDVIERGNMRLLWACNRKTGIFGVTIMVWSKTLKRFETLIVKKLHYFDFALMFADAAHWIG